jgi:hypothetical protein
MVWTLISDCLLRQIMAFFLVAASLRLFCKFFLPSRFLVRLQCRCEFSR